MNSPPQKDPAYKEILKRVYLTLSHLMIGDGM
jgi:hypothetical protein